MNNQVENSAIEKLLTGYADALNASDLAKTVALYTTDGTIMPQGAPFSKGHQQLKPTYEGLFKAFQLHVEYHTDEIVVNGDVAYARTNSKGETTIRASGDKIPVDNKELFVLQKVDGQWRISIYVFNNNKMK